MRSATTTPGLRGQFRTRWQRACCTYPTCIALHRARSSRRFSWTTRSRRQSSIAIPARKPTRARSSSRAGSGARYLPTRRESSRCAAHSTGASSRRWRQRIAPSTRRRSCRSRPACRSWSARSDIDAALDARTVAAVILEPVQGEGGVRVIDRGLLAELRALTHERRIALIFDEIQCGLGRTGTLFAYEQTGVVPDMVTLAKPIAAGLPMGAVLV